MAQKKDELSITTKKTNDNPPKIDLNIDDYTEAAEQETISGLLRKLVIAWGVCTAVFHIYTLVWAPMDPWIFRSLHVMLLSVMGFILIPGWATAKGKPHLVDWLCALGSIFVTAYIIYNFDMLIFRAGVLPTTMDFYVALLGILLILELTRRASGWSLPILCSIFIAYAFLGPYLPGILFHPGYSPERFFTFIYSLNGVFSIPIAISSKYIILFIIFSAFLQVSGVGKFFVEWAFSISGHLRGGPAKVAVIASALMGTMSGTSAGNAVATGSLTIPLMKKVGYSRRFAAATEAVASTGGQIMPPIMGAGVFIMAEMTGIKFQYIMIAGIIPAFLYFVSTYFMIDKEANRLGLHGVPRAQLPDLKQIMKKSYLFIPVLCLFGMIASGFSVILAGVTGIFTAWAISWFTKHNRMGPKKTATALYQGSRGAIQLMAVCAAAGIIMGVIALTGVGLKFANVLLSIAGTSEFLALLFAMCIAIILGMGMPTTAAYAVAASVVAPGLIGMGIEPLLAHFFIFYYACLSAITPPVALAAYAASAISGSNPMLTGVASLRLGIAAYIVPFMFFYHPAILMIGHPLEIMITVIFALIGIYALASAVQKWYWGKINLPVRVILLIATLFLVSSEAILYLFSLAILVILFLVQRAKTSK